MRVFAPIASLVQRRTRATLALLTLTGAASCLDLNPNITACSVTIAPSSLAISMNQAAQISATAFDCKGNSIAKKTITFATANSAVATITIGGQVIAVGVGSTTISAVADGKSASLPVTVTPEFASSVTVNPPTATLRRGNARQFNAVPLNAQGQPLSGQNIRWTSSNSSIASVSTNGTVTALTAGTVNITADANNIFGSATVIVTELPIGSCALTPSSFKVTAGQNVQPTLALRDTANAPLTTLGRPVVWTSDNESVAVVSGSGFVTTRRAGTARITVASVEYPAITCSATVEVVDPRIVQVVIQQRTGSLRIGIPRGLSVALLDSTNTQVPAGRIVTWTSSTPTIASVSQAGIVTGIALGTARVVATSEGVSDTVSFPVTRIPVGSITVTPLQAAIVEGRTVQINATVTDSAGTIVTDRTIEWLTSDPSRATVSNTGLVTATAPGNVLITATTENRAAQSSIVIQQIPVDQITTPSTAITVKVGNANQTAFSFTVLDANGNTLRNRTVAITNSSPGVVSATALTTGNQVNVQGITPGSSTLTLQALNTNGQNDGRPVVVTITVIP